MQDNLKMEKDADLEHTLVTIIPMQVNSMTMTMKVMEYIPPRMEKCMKDK